MNFFTNFQIFFDDIHNFFSQKQYFNFFMAAFDKIKGYIDWLIDWFIDWLIDSFIDWLIDSFIHSFIHKCFEQFL